MRFWAAIILTQQRLDGIQILRFIAAAMVLVQHSVYLPSVQYGLDVMPFRKINIGGTGVYIFFVISGYVISRLINQHPSRFIAHRLARIYPPYIVASVLAVIMLSLCAGLTLSTVNWTPSLSLLPLGGALDGWTHIPFWTLIYEMTFYIVTFILMFGGKLCFDVGIVVWAALIIAVGYFSQLPPMFATNIIHVLMSPLSLLFIAGATLARLHAGASWPLATTALIMWAAFWKTGTLYQSMPMFAVGATAAIHLAVRGSEYLSESRWAIPFIRCGDYSYGLYLIHLPIIVAMISLGLTKTTSYPVAVVICLALAGSLGVLFGWGEFLFHRHIMRVFVDRLATSAQPSGAKITAGSQPAARTKAAASGSSAGTPMPLSSDPARP